MIDGSAFLSVDLVTAAISSSVNALMLAASAMVNHSGGDPEHILSPAPSDEREVWL